tara:strand:+ start:897 stop:1694 length:798 start_codon:yes stop_codon:yes gene_type:complete
MSKSSAPLTIRHVATGLSVMFDKYFLTEFQDTIDTSYNSVSTFGRMDPIMNYQGSTRKISVGLEMQPENETERTAAHKYSSILQKMQYPVYERSENALTIQRPPIVVVRLGNLIRSGDNGGLICALSGYGFTPKTGFTPENSPFVRFGSSVEGGNIEQVEASSPDKVLFTSYSFKFDLTVLHNLPVGFSSQATQISDPDKILYNDSNMRFLGGYYFGNAPIDFGDEGEPVYAQPDGGRSVDIQDITSEEAVVPGGRVGTGDPTGI